MNELEKEIEKIPLASKPVGSKYKGLMQQAKKTTLDPGHRTFDAKDWSAITIKYEEHQLKNEEPIIDNETK